jgi:hypothetical protein
MMKKYNAGFAQIILILIVVAMVGFCAYYFGTLSTPNKLNDSKNIETSDWYTVAYPNYFFITQKTYNTFEVADTKFLGNNTHIPTAGIRVYTNIIPKDMNLTDWLNGIGDISSPFGTVKPCKNFIAQLKNQLKFGDFFNGPDPIMDCMYGGVSEVKLSSVGGIPAIQFKTEAVSSSTTHTILKLNNSSGTTELVDINYSLTGQSDSTDRTSEAYQSFLSSFKPNQN